MVLTTLKQPPVTLPPLIPESQDPDPRAPILGFTIAPSLSATIQDYFGKSRVIANDFIFQERPKTVFGLFLLFYLLLGNC